MTKSNREHLNKLRIAAAQKTKERDYWLKQLSGEPVKTSFPPLPRQIVGTDEGDEAHRNGEQAITFPPQLTERLFAMSKGSPHALYFILAAGVALLLKKYSGRRDILLAAPIYKQANTTDLINTVLVLRNQLEENPSFKEVLLQVRRTIVEATEHYAYPIQLLPELLNLPHTEKGEPAALTDTAILLENLHRPGDIAHPGHNVTLSFAKEDNRLQGRIIYNRRLYTPDYITQIAAHLVTLLQQAGANPAVDINDIELLSPEEKKTLLESLNDTHTQYPRDKTIAQLFEDQARRTPDAVAVYGPSEERLTYGRLNRRAGQLAQLLVKKGVGPGVIVALMVERSLEMITAILGILKAGGAYLPIEPGTPLKRVTHMLEDSRATLLLTSDHVAGQYSFTALQGLKSKPLSPVKTPPRPQITRLDRLPFPDRSLVNYEKYHKYIGVAMVKHTLPLMTSRGCPYKCAYCHNMWPKKQVMRSAENIFEEVLHYYKLGIRRFVILDDIFNLDVKTSGRFYKMILDHKLDIHMFLPGGVRGDILTGEYIDLMVEAGTVNFMMALESACPRIQKMVGKNLNIPRFRDNLQYIIEKHPQVILEMNVMIGFPTETREEAAASLEFVKQHRWLDFPNLNILKIYANTRMEQLALANGISREAIENSFNRAYHQLPDTLPFDKNFARQCQTELFNDYFMDRERLLAKLPHQMKIMSEDEMAQKYDSYLPVDIRNFDELLDFLKLSREDLGGARCLDDRTMTVPRLDRRLRAEAAACYHVSGDVAAETAAEVPAEVPADAAAEAPAAADVPAQAEPLRVLLLELSKTFSSGENMLYDVVESPLGLMYLMTHIKQRYGQRIEGKIAHARMDFDGYGELKTLVQQFRPDVIGVRTLTFYKDFYHRTLSHIRRWQPHVPIIAGGPYATGDWDTALQDPNIDVVVLGEGEITFAELIGGMLDNRNRLPAQSVLETIPGLAFVPSAQRAQSRADASCSREIIPLDTLDFDAPAPASSFQPPQARSSDPCYVIYTSGSSGLPKGTLTTNANVVRVVTDTNYIRLTPRDRLLQLSNYAFDGSVFDIYGALLNGAALVMVTPGQVADLESLSGRITRMRVNVFFVTTALFNALVDYKPDVFRGIRRVLFGGERVSVAHTRKALEIMGPGKILHMYGPTETTVYATYYPVERIAPEQETIPIGRPLSNTSVYILDSRLQLVPTGVTGEIYIGGDGVCRGYLNRPELTASTFIAPPDSSLPSPLYKSGDLARRLPGGDIEFIGRVDQQVKIRGFRIEPGEIEKQLLRLPGIEKAVVTVREESPGEKSLCAYIIPANAPTAAGTAPEAEEEKIKGDLSMHLPPYMLPTHILALAEFPLTANGKVDIAALPLPGTGADPLSDQPATSVEEKFRALWADVLGMEKERIGMEDNFFAIGGHSIKATILISKIQQTFNVKLPLAKLFQTPTIRGLAPLIPAAQTDEFQSIQPVEKKEYYPLSHAQKRIHTACQIREASISNNIPSARVIRGELNPAALNEAFNILIQRHESLRTVFINVDGRPVQKVLTPSELSFQVELVDFAAEAGETPMNRLRPLVEQYAAEPFDLVSGPLLRVVLFTSAPRTHVLFFNLHHIVSDYISSQVMFRELIAQYSALQQGRSHEAAPLRIQYKDYSAWHNRQLQGSQAREHLAYWRRQLAAPLPLMELPRDFERPPMQTFDGSQVNGMLEGDDFTRFKALCDERRLTLFMGLLSALNILFFNYSGQTDIVLGTVTVGREHVDLQEQIGYFLNTLALRTRFQADHTVAQLLRHVGQLLSDAYQHQAYPFDKLLQELEIPRQINRSPVFDVMVDMLNYLPQKQEDTPVVSSPQQETDAFDFSVRAVKFDLSVVLVEKAHSLDIQFQYNTGLFKRTTIERMVKRFETLLQRMPKETGTPLSRLKLEKKRKAPAIKMMARK